MLDIGFHQGSSLYSHAPQDELRLIAVASPQTETHGLEILWQVCLHLQRMGYPVVVLDGTARESESSPGLLDLLTHEPWNESLPAAGQHSMSSLAVLPSMLGLHNLANQTQQHTHPLQALHPLFRRYALVVVHAPVATLASALLAGTMVSPLLLMSPGKHGVVDSYRQLKHLALHAGLVGTVACVTHPGQPGQHTPARQALLSLRHTAARHLGQKIRTSLIEANSAQDLQRLALQLLENACTINASGMGTALPSLASAGFSSPIVQSH